MKYINKKIWVSLILLGAILCWIAWYEPIKVAGLIIAEYLNFFLYGPILKVGRQIFFAPLFYVAVALILFLEKCFPAKPQQKMFSVSLCQDTVWLIF